MLSFMSHHQSSNILCVAVGSILPLLSPRINSPFPPNYFRLKNQPDSPSSPHCSWEGHGYCYPSARVQKHFPPEQNRSVESSRHFFLFPLFTLLWNLQGPAAVTHLCHLFIISTNAPQSDIELWSLPHFCEITFWSLSSMAFYFFELLYIIQKWQCLASPKVSQSAFQAPSNLSQIVLSPFYRCK